ncbi:hypothetical protein FGF1_25490 [Flavobacteriaceae bacterium GF1]
MEILARKVSIPMVLHELHGQQSTLLDLLLTYTIAILTTMAALHLAAHSFDGTYKFVILGILVFDLSGGVVSNFTEGTTKYYSDKPKARSIFIVLHVIQPLVLVWLFPENVMAVAIISTYTLMAMIVVNHIKEHPKQRVCGAFFMAVGLTSSFLVSEI